MAQVVLWAVHQWGGMSVGIQNSVETNSVAPLETSPFTRRKHNRFEFFSAVDWDFFTSGSGNKKGYLENLSTGGCLLRANEPIEHRRWIRILMKEPKMNLWFTAVGRVIRREDRMEPWEDSDVTLYRYGIEFTVPINEQVIESIRASHSVCDECQKAPGTIPDLTQAGRIFCVLCHLRRACNDLISSDGFDQQQA